MLEQWEQWEIARMRSIKHETTFHWTSNLHHSPDNCYMYVLLYSTYQYYTSASALFTISTDNLFNSPAPTLAVRPWCFLGSTDKRRRRAWMGREQSWARDDDDDSDHDDKEDHDNNQNYFARKIICTTQIEIVSTIEATSIKITPTKFYQQLLQQLLSFLSLVPLSHFFTCSSVSTQASSAFLLLAGLEVTVTSHHPPCNRSWAFN